MRTHRTGSFGLVSMMVAAAMFGACRSAGSARSESPAPAHSVSEPVKLTSLYPNHAVKPEGVEVIQIGRAHV